VRAFRCWPGSSRPSAANGSRSSPIRRGARADGGAAEASELFAALRILVLIDEERGLFDRGAEEGGYRSEELEKALEVVRAAVAQ
jgi:hypothetical protein